MKENDNLTVDSEGLIPAIVQDSVNGDVLMLAYMNRESLGKTVAAGETFFWSRSRRSLWHKGETSGNVQKVESITADCDGDALLVKVRQIGNACHTGKRSCFFTEVHRTAESQPSFGRVLEDLAAVIHQRNLDRPPGSYTTELLSAGTDRILRKIGEEAGETIIAAKNHSAGEIAWEVSDLLYHLLVLLEAEGVPLDAVSKELSRRAGARLPDPPTAEPR